MKDLFDVQVPVVKRTLEALAERLAGNATGGVLLNAPTGAGKTVMTAHAVRSLPAATRTLFVAERNELLEQAITTFQEHGLQVGTLVAGHRENLEAPVVVASKGKLAARYRNGKPLPKADVLVVDEAHRAVSKEWLDVLLNAYRDAVRLGLSATPERLDGQGLNTDGLFTTMVAPEVSVEELIERGRLAPIEYVSAVDPKEWQLSVKGREFDARSSERIMMRLAPQIASAYVRLAKSSRRALAFCVSTRQADHLAESLTAVGIPAVAVHSRVPASQRRQALDDLAAARIRVLVSVDLFIEGLDVPDVDTIVLARPTLSRRVFLQAIGRGMRAAPGKVLRVLDAAGNVYRHGLPTWDLRQEWSLDAHEVDTSAQARRGIYRDSLTSCGHCGQVHVKGSACSCGHTAEATHIDGVLKRPRGRSRGAMRLGVDEATDQRVFAQLVAYALEHDRRNPREWALKAYRVLGGTFSAEIFQGLEPREVDAATHGFFRANRRAMLSIR